MVDLSIIPDGWFLLRLAHIHSAATAPDGVRPAVHWLAELQCVHMGDDTPKTGVAPTPQDALEIACKLAK